MKQMSLLVGAVFFALATTATLAAGQNMPAPPSGKMMEEKKDPNMGMKMEGKTTSGMTQEGMKSGDMKPEKKIDEMDMKMDKGNMQMEKK